MIGSSKIAFGQMLVGYKLNVSGLQVERTENAMNIRKSINPKVDELIKNEFIRNIAGNVVAGIILLPIALIFGNLFGCESSDAQPDPSSPSGTWEVVEFPIVERGGAFRSVEVIRGGLRHIYWERSYIQIERQIRCVRVQDKANRFYPDAIVLCEEISLDYRYRNGDLPDHFLGFGR